MVVGGEGAEKDVEIVDLSGENRRCRKPKNYNIDSGSTGIFFNGHASVCGGNSPRRNVCYKYDAEVSHAWYKSINFLSNLNIPFRMTNGFHYQI